MRRPARLLALEKVRSTTTLRPCLTSSSVSGKSGPCANSRYASSNTTMVRSGTRDMKCATSSLVTMVLEHHHHADAAGGLHDHRVDHERRVRHHRLVARPQEGAHDQLDELVG